MSDCGCGSNEWGGDNGAYNGYCNADTPYPSVSHESVPSLIDNLVIALYGEIQKDVSSGKVVWNIPCDPSNAPATVFNIARNQGEGLLCYFIRAFNQANNGQATFYGNFVGPLTGTASQATISTRATNLAGGAANSIPYQTAANTTALLPAGTNGKVLGILSGALAWVSAPASTSAINLAGGVANSLPYQTASGLTSFLPAGQNNQVLTTDGGLLAWKDPTGGGGGSTPVTLNVKDYGAVGNGTTDDTIAIQAAITAAVAIGNAIVEFEPTTYLLNTLAVSTACPSWYVASFLRIVGGTTNLKITLKGNGAVLYTNKITAQVPTASGDENYMLYAATLFDSVKVENLTFTRGPASLPFGNGGIGGVRFHPVNNTAVGTIEITGCKFINQHWAFDVWNRGIEASAFGKLKKLFVSRCEFLYPYGATSGSNTTGGGGQVARVNGWVQEAHYDECYADGITGGVLPAGVTFPKDGFTICCAIKSKYTNCKFVNFWVETLNHVPSNNGPCNLNSFTQPAVGSSVSVTIPYLWTLAVLYVGKNYTVVRNSGAQTAAGIYTLTSWNGQFGSTGQVTLTRLDDSLLGFGSEDWSSAATGSTVPAGAFVQVENLQGFSLEVTNCRFGDGTYLYNNNGTPLTLGGYHNAMSGGTPAIAAGTLPTIVNGNIFEGCNGTLKQGQSFSACIPAPAIFSNNLVLIEPVIGVANGNFVVTATTGGVLSGNTFISDDSTSIINGNSQNAVIVAKSNDCSIVNNSFVNKKVVTTTYPTYGIEVGTASNGRPFSANIQYNNFKNYDRGVRTFKLTTDGTNQGVFLSRPSGFKVRNQKEPFNPTKNGWVRLNYSVPYGTWATTINFFNLKFEASATGYQIGVITVLRNNDSGKHIGVVPISAIRTVGSYSNYLDVYVNDYTQMQLGSGDETGYVYSTTETGQFNLLVKQSSVITAIASNGTGTALVTSASHGLSNNDAIYISGSNSTPSIDGGYLVSSVTANTFVITKSGLLITTSGTAGEFLYNPQGEVLTNVCNMPITTKTSFVSSLGTGDISGTGAPTISPSFFGQCYYDTNNAKWYKAAGIQFGSSEWKLLN